MAEYALAYGGEKIDQLLGFVDELTVTTDELNNMATADDVMIMYRELESKINALNNVSLPVVLYNNPSGTSEDILLDNAVEEFEYLEIYASMKDGVVIPFTKIYAPSRKTADLIWVGTWSAGTIACARARISISGGLIKFVSNAQVTINSEGISSSTDEENLIYITRILGYTDVNGGGVIEEEVIPVED